MGPRLIRAATLAVLAAACARTPEMAATTVVTSPPVSAVETTIPPSDSCSQDESVEGGAVGALPNPGSDAQSLSGITWATLPGCERFTLVFASSEGAPATTPPSVDVAYLGQAPVIRMELGITSSVIREQLVGTGLVERVYVVRALDGSMFVDLLLAGPAKASIDTSDSPAGITLELQPGIVDHLARPVTEDDLVLITPLDDAVTGSTVTVGGYTRGHNDGVVVIATTGDVVLGEHLLPQPEDTWSWSEFTTELALDAGSVSLFVGERLAGTGLDGVSITLTVS